MSTGPNHHVIGAMSIKIQVGEAWLAGVAEVPLDSLPGSSSCLRQDRNQTGPNNSVSLICGSAPKTYWHLTCLMLCRTVTVRAFLATLNHLHPMPPNSMQSSSYIPLCILLCLCGFPLGDTRTYPRSQKSY
jgi:hypothetical protein